MEPLHPLVAYHCHPVDHATVRATLAEPETTISHSRNMGAFTIHHGHRFGAPIVIVENHGDGPSDESAIWYDEAGRAND
jgi:hypothetical protein